MKTITSSSLPIALNPEWSRADFYYRAHQISAQLQQDNIQAVALWFDDATYFACVLLACLNAKVRVLLPPNLVGDNQQWVDENADLLFNDAGFADYGISQKIISNRPLVGQGNQTEVWLKTSGSSGNAKIVVKTAEQLWQEAEIVAQILPFATEQQVHLVSSVSVQHFYGLTYRVMLPLLRGWVIDRLQHTFPDSFLQHSRHFGKALWITSPTFLTGLDINRRDIHRDNLCGIVTSGGALAEVEAMRIAQKLNVPLIEGYGSTETGVIAIRQGTEYWTTVPDVKVGVNEEGALWVESHRVPQREQTADAVEFYPQGFLLLGRIDRIAKLGDKRISLIRIEQDLMQHHWVADCFIAPHIDHKHRPLAWVALSDEGMAEYQKQGRKALIRTLRQHLLTKQERFALPRYWRFTDKLPRNSQSKILRQDFEQICKAH